jgi:hypothetical protein
MHESCVGVQYAGCSETSVLFEMAAFGKRVAPYVMLEVVYDHFKRLYRPMSSELLC